MDSTESVDLDDRSTSDMASKVAHSISSSARLVTSVDSHFNLRRSQSMVLSDDELTRDSSDDDSEAPVMLRAIPPSITDFSPESVFDGTSWAYDPSNYSIFDLIVSSLS